MYCFTVFLVLFALLHKPEAAERHQAELMIQSGQQQIEATSPVWWWGGYINTMQSLFSNEGVTVTIFHTNVKCIVK